MKEPKTQEERLDWLVERFKAEDMGYMSIPTPAAARIKASSLSDAAGAGRLKKVFPKQVWYNDPYLF